MNNWKMSKTMIVICCLLALAAVALLAWSVADDSAPGWVLPAVFAAVLIAAALLGNKESGGFIYANF